MRKQRTPLLREKEALRSIARVILCLFIIEIGGGGRLSKLMIPGSVSP